MAHEELDLTGINIDGYRWQPSVLKANYGDGYKDLAVVGDAAGLWRWSLHSDCLPDDPIYSPINGLARFDYYWDFFQRHTTGAGVGGDVFIIEFRGKKWHAGFAENYISGDALTADLFNGDVEVEQRRVKGFTYSSDGSIDTNPPSVPVLLTAVAVGSDTIRLTWSGSTDDPGDAYPLAGYEVWVDATTVIDAGNVLTYDVGTLGPGTSHGFSVRSYDGSPTPNRSDWSNSLVGTTDEAPVGSITDEDGSLLTDEDGSILIDG
jgi:hypothetical protein